MESIIFSISTSPHWINEPRNRIQDSAAGFWGNILGYEEKSPSQHPTSATWTLAMSLCEWALSIPSTEKKQEIVVVSVSVISQSHNHSKFYLLKKKTVVVSMGQECGSCSESFKRFQSDVSWGLQHLKVSRGPKVSLPRWLTHAAGELVSLHGGLSTALNVNVFMKWQLASPKASNPRDQDGNSSYFMSAFGSHIHHFWHILLVSWGSS